MLNVTKYWVLIKCLYRVHWLSTAVCAVLEVDSMHMCRNEVRDETKLRWVKKNPQAYPTISCQKPAPASEVAKWDILSCNFFFLYEALMFIIIGKIIETLSIKAISWVGVDSQTSSPFLSYLHEETHYADDFLFIHFYRLKDPLSQPT